MIKTMKEQTLEFYERVRHDIKQNSKFRHANLQVSRKYGCDVAQSAIDGDIEAMLEIGTNCLYAIGVCDNAFSALKMELAAIGLYWLNEVTLYDHPNNRYNRRMAAEAYEYLVSAYVDINLPIHHLLCRDYVQEVIPQNVDKLKHYLWQGAQYSEICAYRLVAHYLEGIEEKQNVKLACKHWQRILPLVVNTHINKDTSMPMFLLEAPDLYCYEYLSEVFEKVGAISTAREIDELLQKIRDKN